jgi:hypothetical protein
MEEGLAVGFVCGANALPEDAKAMVPMSMT